MTGPLTPDELQAHLVVRDAIRQHVIATKGKMPRRVFVSRECFNSIPYERAYYDGCEVIIISKWKGVGAMTRACRTWVSSDGENTTA